LLKTKKQKKHQSDDRRHGRSVTGFSGKFGKHVDNLEAIESCVSNIRQDL